MANLHGFPNLNNPNNPNPNQGYLNLDPGVRDQIPFMNVMKGDQRSPMQETISYTLKILCCPDIKPFSNTSAFLLAIWIIYIICLANGISTENHEVLEVQDTVLINFGAALGTLIQQGQVFRLITASLLHVNLLHILMNSLTLLFFLTRFEKLYPRHTPLILILSSITGFMLSVLCDRTTPTVGASTALFGVFGGFIAYLIINWVTLERYGPVRTLLTCIIGIIVCFSLLFSIGSNIDIIAHIGGLLGGLLISLGILPGMQPKNKILTIVGLSGVLIMNFITFMVFFLTD